MTTHSHVFDFNACIVRPVSSALLKALRMEEPENPIDIKKAFVVAKRKAFFCEYLKVSWLNRLAHKIYAHTKNNRLI